MIRRAILKAVAIPGYQVPFASREMPMPYGWGTGGVQVTAAILGPDDVLKVIDQGADDTTNAVSIRAFFVKTADVRTTTDTSEATIIQTRHRVPETPLSEGQILVYQVPIPEPLRFLEPRETETRTMHALGEYGVMHVKLYEDISRHGHIATTYAYPARVAGRYIMDPSPIPKFDNPKLDDCPALQLFGAGREKRIYAIPPYTRVVPLDFEDHPFERTKFDAACALCGATDSYLDEVVTDDAGGRHVRLLGHRLLREAAGRQAEGRRRMSAALLVAGGICKRYGAIQACRDISFEIEEGEALAIVGESGSGKTTLLHLIAGLTGAGRRRSPLSPARRRRARSFVAVGSRAAGPDAHRLGLRASGRRAGPAHERVRRRQHRRAPDGARRPSLRAHSRRAPPNGWNGSRSRPTGSTTRPGPIPAACASDCRSPAIS